MLISSDLNDKNFLLYAARHYENPMCTDMDEFYNDLLIPIHLKKLFTRYTVNKVLKERLIINHLISFFNCFHPIAATKILFYKMDPGQYVCLKTFLVYLNRCPEVISVGGKIMQINKIPNDITILNRLRNGTANGN